MVKSPPKRKVVVKHDPRLPLERSPRRPRNLRKSRREESRRVEASQRRERRRKERELTTPRTSKGHCVPGRASPEVAGVGLKGAGTDMLKAQEEEHKMHRQRWPWRQVWSVDKHGREGILALRQTSKFWWILEQTRLYGLTIHSGGVKSW